MPYSNISAVMLEADKTAILTKINEIKALLPFLVNLTPEERRTLPKMGDGNEPFVSKALNYAETNANLVPPFLSVPELRKDYNLVQVLDAIDQALGPLAEAVRDTNLAAGSEAYTGGLTFYKAVQMAANLNVPGAGAIVDDLAERFAGQGGSGGDTPPPPPVNP